DESRMPQCSIWDDPDLARKIREACRVAREAGYQYLWIDSCCIDKASSSELSEAINSMYDWYGRAEVCYVYLADVSSGEDPYACQSSFRSSRWHRRGWTLQELIAPRAAIFLSKDWESIGSKHALAALVEEITMIPREALLHLESLDEYSVAERLSWAAQRETTRAEDRAYSLLGIFDINMHTLYGEGERAFRRLQEEILRRVPDQSLFAWGNVYADTEAHQDLAQCPLLQAANSITCGISDDVSETALFAPHPEKLTKGGKIRAVSHNDVFRRLRLSHLPVTQYVSTPHGIQMQIPVIPLARCLRHGAVQDSEHTLQSRWYLAILGCEHVDHPGALLGRVCYIPSSESGIDHLYCGFAGPGHLYMHFNLFPLSSATMERCHEDIQLKTVYISHPIRATLQPGTARYEPHEKVNLVLRRKTRDALRTEGYTAELRGPDQEEPTTHWLTLSSDDHIITIVYRQTLDDDSKELTVEAHVTMSRPSLNSSGDVQIVYRSVKWRESVYSAPWGSLLSSREIMLAVAPRKLTVTLGLDWATSSHYFLRVEINSRPLLVTPATSLELAQDEVCRTPGSGGRGVGLQVIGADGKEA
ncbi:HET-domain-containing protein, partial [Dichomitus squalens]